MKGILGAGMAIVMCGTINGALAQDREREARELREVREVTVQVQRVRPDGIIELKLRQGPTAALVISGEPAGVSKTVTRQRGDTLIIDNQIRTLRLSDRERPIQAELTLPQLREVVSNSLGWTEISGFKGDRLDLVLDGAGSMKVNGSYRVLHAALGGLGSMTIQAALSEGLELDLHGAGYVTVAGQGRWLRANLGGLGGLDAQQFQVDSVEVELGGLGNAVVYARQHAALQLNGLGSAAVYGRPASRNAEVNGLGRVTFK
jgi:hypothetical protein